MNVSRPLLAFAVSFLVAACAPEPTAAPEVEHGAPALEPPRSEAAEARREAAETALEAVQKAGEAARKIGEGALESMRARTEPATQDAVPVEERAAVPLAGREPAGR